MEIRHRIMGYIIYQDDEETMSATLRNAIYEEKDLKYADLRGYDLSYMDLSG